MMLTIDGSHGEGGGQILRTAISLSVVTHTPVTITNIRANRPKPGLKPQHYTALLLMKQLSQAKTEGLEIGSSTLSFSPGMIKSGRYQFDVGTAGSITLVFQTCLPSALQISSPLEIQLTGGTDVRWSPSWDYLIFVFLPFLRQCGLHVDATLVRRGYYPKGGGRAVLRIHPCEKIQGILFDQPPVYKTIGGRVHVGALPDHVGVRMKHHVVKSLLKQGFHADISLDAQTTLSPGAGVSLWAVADTGRLGCCVLGEKGVPAETVASTAVQTILDDIVVGATLDEHLFDQILLYLVLAKGKSVCYVRSVSSHAQTTMWLLQQFFPGKHLFSIDESAGLTQVVIQGVG